MKYALSEDGMCMQKVIECKALRTYIKRSSTSTHRAYREYIKEVARYRLYEQQPMNFNPLSQL